MSISLVEVAGANFRTDYDSDKLNTDFMGRLGMRKRYLPARLAISRSLAISAPVDTSADELEPGKVIKGDTLFGTGTALSVWLSLIVERSGEPDIDTKRLISLVGAHWRRGLAKLDEEWEQAGQDVAQFVRRLVEVAELPTAGGRLPSSRGNGTTGTTFSSGEIKVLLGEIGEDVATKEKVYWSLNGTGGAPHAAVMGGSGSGKTVMAAAMLRGIREQAPVPLIAFDFKGDLAAFTGTKGQAPLGEVFDAQVIEPPRMPIPLDVLALTERDPFGIDQAASRFRESFSRLKGARLGDRQRTYVHEAAARALASESPCELRHIHDRLLEVYQEHEAREDGAVANMEELCRFPLFEPEMSPAEFFQRSWIIKLPPTVAEDSRTIVVNLLLDALDQYLNSLEDSAVGPDGARGLRVLCMVDEAHQILGTKLPSLSRLIRMSRSKGGAVMLVSQSPDDFSGEEDDFLDNMGLVAAFATNAKPGAAARVLGKGANLTNLQKGQCFARFDQSTKKIKAWRPAREE
ncbi:ATP-binding protein [Oceanicella sp. SM1341]|uniref:ATP-binding protein n=1 Tax=Oceanicella sp. SM1341 TaxID=1548889 RepID=UPI000E54B637|nr:type IV secretion system DNA-binding domain-containing protein [Oceanicella sp. SM1341]